MIDKIFDLGETTVREVMVPLVDVVALPDDRQLRRRGRADPGARLLAASRLSPTAMTNIVGVVTAMDLLSRGAQVRTATDADAPADLRAGDQAHRRPAARDAEGPQSSWRSWWTSTAAPSAS